MGEMRNVIHVHLLHPIRRKKKDMKRVYVFFPQCLSLIFAFIKGFWEHFWGSNIISVLVFFTFCPLCCVSKTLSLPASEAGEVALMHFELPVSLWWIK